MRRLTDRLITSLLSLTLASASQAQSKIDNVAAPAGAGPQFWIDVDPFDPGMQAAKVITTDVGGTFSVDVIVYNVPAAPRPLRAAHFWIHYDPAVIRLSGFTEPLLVGPPFITTPIACGPPGSLLPIGVCPGGPPTGALIQMDQGAIPGNCPPGAGPSGVVTLARLVFTVVSLGQSGLEIGPGPGAPWDSTALYRWGTAAEGECTYGLAIATVASTFLSRSKARVVIDPEGTLSCLNVNKVNDLPALLAPAGMPLNNPDTVSTALTLGIDDVTLRSAIQVANALTGDNRITFRTTVAPTIALTAGLTALADVTGGTHIDGTTQSAVVVDGVALAPSITVTSAFNLIEYVTVNSTPAAPGILITGAGATGNQVRACNLGTNAAGTAAVANGQGIRIDVGASGNLIGGTRAEGNLISGNTTTGLVISDADTTGNFVYNNLIGTNISADGEIANGEGVLVTLGASANIIGGPDTTLGNLISGNTTNGVRLCCGAFDNHVEVNWIGTDGTGDEPLRNDTNGVAIQGSAHDNVVAGNRCWYNGTDGIHISGMGTDANVILANDLGFNLDQGLEIADGAAANMIGGFSAVTGNTIISNLSDGVQISGGNSSILRFNQINSNAAAGVRVLAGTDNSIRMNSIHGNGPTLDGLGIDLGLDGVTFNDPGDGDAGPNNLMNHPMLASALAGSGITTISGFADVAGAAPFVLDVYTVAACDTFLHGEGAIYVGSAAVSAGGFSVALPVALAPGTIITATLTDDGLPMIGDDGNTSEFSLCLTVGSAPSPCPADLAPGGGDGLVSTPDLLFVINAWGPCPSLPTPCPADIAPPGGNGSVGTPDLLAIINAWGMCPP